MIARVIAMIVAALVAATLIVLLLPRPVAGPGPTGAPATSTTPPASARASSPAPSSPVRSPLPGEASDSWGMGIRASLLDLLPAAVAGSDVTRDRDREDQTVKTPGLATYAAGLAAATVGDDGENLASALLVEARPATEMADWFVAWRADFDAAACEAIGGAGTTREETIGGRAVYVTACGGGATVYHALVAGGRVILSVFELGPQKFGRQLLENLAPGA